MPQEFKSVHQIEAEKRKMSLQVNTSLPPLSPLDAKASPLFRNGPTAPVTTFTPREPSPKSSTKNVSALSLLLSNSNSSSAVSSPALAQNERKRMNTSFRLSTPSPLLVSAMNNSLNIAPSSANSDGTAPSSAATTRTVPHQQELHRAMFRQQAMQQQQQWQWQETTIHGETVPVAAKSYSKEFGDFASSYRSDSDEDEEEVYGGGMGAGGEAALRARDDVLLRLDQESERERERLTRERGEKMHWHDLSDSDSDVEALPSDAVAYSFAELDFSRSFISASSPSLSSPSPARAHTHIHTHTHTLSTQQRSAPRTLPPAPPLPPQREQETDKNMNMNMNMNYPHGEKEREREMDTLSCRDLLCGLIDHDLSPHTPHTTEQQVQIQQHLLPADLFLSLNKKGGVAGPLHHHHSSAESEVERGREREKVLGRLQLFAVELNSPDDNVNNKDNNLRGERGACAVEYEIQDFLPPFAAQTLLYDLGVRDFVVTDKETHRVCLFVQLLVGPAGSAENTSSSAADLENEQEKREWEKQRERDRAALYAEEEFYTIDVDEDGEEGFYTLEEGEEEGFYTLPDDDGEGFYTLEEDEVVNRQGSGNKAPGISAAPSVQQNVTNMKRELPPVPPLARQESETDSDDFDPDTAVPFRTDTDEAKLCRDLERMDRERERERERQQQQREREQQKGRSPQVSIAMMCEDDVSLCEDAGDGAIDREREFFVRCRSAVSDPWRTVRLLREQKRVSTQHAHTATEASTVDVTPQTNPSKRVSSAAIPIVFNAREGEMERDRERERLHLQPHIQPHLQPHMTQKHTHTLSERDMQRESDALCAASQDSLEAYVQQWAESSPYSSEKINYHHHHLYVDISNSKNNSNRNSNNYNSNSNFNDKTRTPERSRHRTQEAQDKTHCKQLSTTNQAQTQTQAQQQRVEEEDGELDERLLLFKERSGDSDKTDISYEDYVSRLTEKEKEREREEREREERGAKEKDKARENSIDSTLSQTAPRFKRSTLFQSHPEAHSATNAQQRTVPPFLINPVLMDNNNNSDNIHPQPMSSSPSPISREASNQTDSGSQRTTSTSNTTPATRTSSSHAAHSLSSTSFLFPNDREFLMDGQNTPSEFRRNSSTGSRRGSERFNSLDGFPKYLDPHLQKSTVVTSASGTPSQTHRKRSSKKKELVLDGKPLPAHRLSHNSHPHSPTSDALPRRHTYNNAWSVDERDLTTTSLVDAHADTLSAENPAAQKTVKSSSSSSSSSAATAASTVAGYQIETTSVATATLTPDRAHISNNDSNKKNRSWSLSLNRLWNVFSFSGSVQSSAKQAPQHASNPSESTHHLAQFALVDDLTDLVVEREREPVRPFEPLILPQEKRASVLVEESEKLADRVKR